VTRYRRAWTIGSRALLVVGLLVAALVPAFFSTYFTGAIAVKVLWLGLAAASLTFLSGQGGMVSLAQTALFGVAGYVTARLMVFEAMSPWLAAAAGVGAATVTGMVVGGVASGTRGIYFLMITLAFAVVAYLFFSQVSTFCGHTGIDGVFAPAPLDNPTLKPTAVYYACLGCCVAAYLLLRYLARTPFGLALAAVRDEPQRANALGFDVRLHRTVAFALAAAVAGVAGVLATWHITSISPGTIDVTRTIELLVVAVIGGLYRLEGAWLGALVYVLLDTYTRGLSGRFETWIGIAFVLIVLVSPGGLAGLVARVDEAFRRPARRRRRRRRRRGARGVLASWGRPAG
jgi:branched-chain amino acid transport system permease protein